MEHQTPRAGNLRRGTIHNNPLLNAPEVGKVKKCCYNLPPKEFAYGATQARDKEGAGAMLTKWQEHEGTKNKPPPRDFRTLNRMSVKESKVTAKQFADFRKTHDARLKQGGGLDNKGNMVALPSDKDPRFTYGMTTLGSDNVNAVITNAYQYEWVREKIHRDQEDDAARVAKARRAIAPTRASLGHQAGSLAARTKENDPTYREPFKLTKFKKTDPRVQIPSRLDATGMTQVSGGSY